MRRDRYASTSVHGRREARASAVGTVLWRDRYTSTSVNHRILITLHMNNLNHAREVCVAFLRKQAAFDSLIERKQLRIETPTSMSKGLRLHVPH